MKQASRASRSLLFGAVAILCLGSLLWLEPWSPADRAPGFEVGQRSGVGERDGPDGSGSLLAVGSSEGRVVEQLSSEALAAMGRSGPGEGAPEAVVQLVGQVLGPLGQPVQGAAVLVTTSRSAASSLGMALEERERSRVCTAETDGEGAFFIAAGDEIPELSEGRTVSVLVRKPGWAVRRQRLGQFPGRLPMTADPIQLKPGSVVAGRVIGPDGLPAEGATVYFGQSVKLGGLRVTAPSRGYLLGTTGSDGTFRCDELEPGPFHLVLEKPGHPAAFYEGVVAAGQALEGVIVRLDRGAAIAGRVESEGTDPSGLWISTWPQGDDAPAVDRRPRGVAPARDGSFELSGLRPGSSYVLSVHADRADRRPRRGGERTTARSGDRDVQLTWSERATVRGQVVQRTANNAGIRPVEAFVLWHTLKASGDKFDGEALEVDGEAAAFFADGRFEVTGLRLEPGATAKMAIRIRSAGFEQLVRVGIPVPHAGDVDLGEIELVRAPALRVRVVDAESGAPLEGARVFLAANGDRKSLDRWRRRDTPAHSSTKTRFAETDESGLALLQPPATRPWLVSANADGFPAGELQSVAGEDEDVIIELTRGSTVRAEVVDMEGAPLVGVDVSMRVEIEGSWVLWRRVVQTDEQGLALFEHVEAGVAVLRAESPRMRPRQPKDWRETSERVEVPPGGEVNVRLVMPVSSQITGRVRLGGTPLADARLRLAVQEDGQLLRPETTSETLRAITNTEGEFALRGVPAGTYQVTVSHRARSMATVFTYEVVADPGELVIELVESGVSGTVVYAGTGEPAGGVTVKVAGPSELHRAWVGQRYLREDWRGGMDYSDRWVEPGKLVTNEDGSFEFPGLTPGVQIELMTYGELVRGGSVTLSAFDEGEVRTGVVLEVEAGSTLRVIAGNTARRRSRRSRDYGIRLSPVGRQGRARTVRSFSGSSYRFTSLRPGRYRVETIDLRTEGYPSVESLEVTLEAGASTEITMPGL